MVKNKATLRIALRQNNNENNVVFLHVFISQQAFYFFL